MGRIELFPDRIMAGRDGHTYSRSRLKMMCTAFFGMVLLAGFAGCERAPAPAEEGAPKHSSGGVQLVRLPPDEVTRSGVTVEPAGRTAFRTYRTFPGVVRPNENALANITTLVRGRVA